MGDSLQSLGMKQSESAAIELDPAAALEFLELPADHFPRRAELDGELPMRSSDSAILSGRAQNALREPSVDARLDS